MKRYTFYHLTAMVVLLIAIVYGCAQMFSVVTGDQQHDFRTYYRAVKAWRQGLNPYDVESLRQVAGTDEAQLPFVYPPYCLPVFQPLVDLGYVPAYFLFLTLKTIALLLLVVVWVRIVPARKSDAWAICVTVLLGYRCAVLRDLRAGNVSLFEQILLWSGVLLAMRNRSLAGGVAILLSSAFKLMTASLAPLVFVIRRSSRSLGIVLFLGVVWGCAHLLLYSAQPALWTSFAKSVGTLDERGDLCPSLWALLLDIEDAAGVAHGTVCIAYAILCGAVLGVWAWSLADSRRSRDVYPMLYLTVLAYVIVAPRMKDYSLVIALLPTLHILSAMGQRRWQSVAGCILLWAPVFAYQSLALAAYAFGLVVHWIRKHRNRPDERMELALNPLRAFAGLVLDVR